MLTLATCRAQPHPRKRDPVLEPASSSSEPLAAPPVGASARPTLVRYGVLALSVSMAVLLYLDRMAINVAIPAIAQDLSVPIRSVADAVAAFFWSYALFQIPAGWLGDRWGGRRALTIYVVAWSLAMIGLGLVGGLAALLAMRLLLGLGQAGAYATTASFLRRWMPFDARGFANSSVSLGGRAGGVLAPILTAQLMAMVAITGVSGAQWRPVFVIYGAFGIAWAWLFWFSFRDRPSEHPRVNAAEAVLIAGPIPGEASEATTESAASHRLPISGLLASPSIWALATCNYFINVGWILVGTMLPTYLITVHGRDEVQAGFAASLVALAGMAGCLLGGFATDFLVRRLGLTWGRRVPCIISYGGAALAYLACYQLNDPAAIVALLVVASFLGDLGLGPLWCTYQDLGGPYAGTVLGIGNMCGNIGAAMAVSFVPRFAEANGWSACFLVSVAAYAIGAATWLVIEPRRPLYRAKALPGAPDGTPA